MYDERGQILITGDFVEDIQVGIFLRFTDDVILFSKNKVQGLLRVESVHKLFEVIDVRLETQSKKHISVTINMDGSLLTSANLKISSEVVKLIGTVFWIPRLVYSSRGEVLCNFHRVPTMYVNFGEVCPICQRRFVPEL